MTTKPAIRKIAGTDAVARHDYVSHDKSVRNYTILAADGTTLGRVTSHSRALARSAGWHEGHRSFGRDIRSWGTLTEAALAFGAKAV